MKWVIQINVDFAKNIHNASINDTKQSFSIVNGTDPKLSQLLLVDIQIDKSIRLGSPHFTTHLTYWWDYTLLDTKYFNLMSAQQRIEPGTFRGAEQSLNY